MNIVLWILQVLLGIYFLFVGVNHFIVPPGLRARTEGIGNPVLALALKSGTFGSDDILIRLSKAC